ncbi:MAG: O-antigen ligase family protein [Metallibacterium sp.]
MKKINLIILMLALIFTASFLPYLIKITPLTLAPAILLLLATAFILVPMLYPKQSISIISILGMKRLFFLIFIVSIFPTIIAVVQQNWYSVGYAAGMILVLISAQKILVVASIRDVLKSLAASALICVPIFVIFNVSLIINSLVDGQRLDPTPANPNSIGFIFAGYLIACAWMATQTNLNKIWKLVYIIVMIVAGVSIFAASSRASMLGLTVGLGTAAYLRYSKRISLKRIPRIVGLGFVCILCASILLVINHAFYSRTEQYVIKVLALNSQFRGFGSGFSGRLQNWQIALNHIASGISWFTGHGYRTSFNNLGLLIDNGYLVVWYELGLMGLLFIIFQIIWLMRILIKFSAINGLSYSVKNLHLALIAIVIAYAINNIFDRYLLSVGNPFSLFCLFLILLSKNDLIKLHE